MKKKKRIRYDRIIIALIIFGLIIFGLLKGINYLFYMTTTEYKLIKIGYTDKSTEILLNNLNKELIDKIIKEKTKDDMLEHFAPITSFNYDKLNDYKSYYDDNSGISYEDAVIRVNIGLNNDFYTNIKKIDQPEKSNVLVNKYHILDKDFVPSTLVKASNQYAYGDNELAKEAYDAFISLFNAAKTDGKKIVIISGYRSYDTQEKLYASYVRNNSEEYAEAYSARAGHSEHQTGLAIDVADGMLPYNKFKDTESYLWLKDNAHKYGFIIRYQENYENITGYKDEPWHIRYVGVDISNYIYKNKISFDEYYAKYLMEQ